MRRRLVESQLGQTTAMVTAMLFALILAVSVVANVGQAINRRVALQMVADAGAFTGATCMSVGLNNMAKINRWIHYAWTAYTWALVGCTIAGATCKCFNGATSAYNATWNAFNAMYQVISKGFSALPYDEARRVSEYNVADLFPGEKSKFKYQEYSTPADPMWQETMIPLWKRDLLDVMSTKEVPDGSYPKDLPAVFGSFKSRTIPCVDFIGPIPYPSVTTLNPSGVWYEKDGTDTKYFVWIVTSPATKAFMFDNLFGPNAIPKMRAVGVAKPVGGEIKTGENDYVTKMVPVSKAMVTSGFIYDSKYNPRFGPPVRPVTH
ncbi:MAG: pilus assembly protein [Acidobacteria bacterium]|nr:pilus assembly protein [Acidobacteriota bacterium]